MAASLIPSTGLCGPLEDFFQNFTGDSNQVDLFTNVGAQLDQTLNNLANASAPPKDSLSDEAIMEKIEKDKTKWCAKFRAGNGLFCGVSKSAGEFIEDLCQGTSMDGKPFEDSKCYAKIQGLKIPKKPFKLPSWLKFS